MTEPEQLSLLTKLGMEQSFADALSEDSIQKPRVEESSLNDLYLLSYSHIGSSHIEDNKPNQDCFNFKEYGNILFVAVGDGLGSYSFSNEGSEIVTRLITAKMKEFVANYLNRKNEATTFEDLNLAKIKTWEILNNKNEIKITIPSLGEFNEARFKKTFIESINDIRIELDKLSEEKNKSNASRKDAESAFTKGDFATTCLFMMTDGNKVFCAQVGDGGIFLVGQTDSKLILTPTKGNAISETVPVTYDGWENYLKIDIFDIPKDTLFLCLMTDGFSDSISDPNKFFPQIVTEVGKSSKSEFKSWLNELNTFLENGSYSDDDKTASFIFFNDIFKAETE
jgi:serine/threonine protein phosphatase PrpC